MRVTMVSGSFPPLVCGVGDYTARLSTALARLGHEVTVITSVSAWMAGGDSDRPGFHLRPTMDSWSLAAAGRLLDEVRRSHPEVVCVQYPASGYGKRLLINIIPLLLKSAVSVPYVLTLHEFRSAHPLRKLSTLFLVSMASRVVVADGSERKALSLFYPGSVIQRTEIILIGSNIDVCTRFEPEAEELDFARSEAVLCFFGLMTSKKDVETLFRAFAQLLESGYDLSLLMIGDVAFHGRPYLRFSRLAKDLGIGDNVYWTGRCGSAEASWYLQQSDICVLPYADGVTLRRGSLIAALRHGMPIVTTKKESTAPSILKNQRNVCLVPVGDVVAMGSAISLLLDDPGLRTRLGSRARALGEQFDWKTIAERYQSLFSSLR